MPHSHSRHVVLDVNVWVSGLIRPSGPPGAVLDAVRKGSLIPVVSDRLLAELSDVLRRPKLARWINPEDATEFLDTLAVIAEIYVDIDAAQGATRDPKDDYLVALSQHSGAILITGDDDILATDLDPPALTPRQLIDLLHGDR